MLFNIFSKEKHRFFHSWSEELESQKQCHLRGEKNAVQKNPHFPAHFKEKSHFHTIIISTNHFWHGDISPPPEHIRWQWRRERIWNREAAVWLRGSLKEGESFASYSLWKIRPGPLLCLPPLFAFEWYSTHSWDHWTGVREAFRPQAHGPEGCGGLFMGPISNKFHPPSRKKRRHEFLYLPIILLSGRQGKFVTVTVHYQIRCFQLMDEWMEWMNGLDWLWASKKIAHPFCGPAHRRGWTGPKAFFSTKKVNH